ncbi:MAG: hypothetical protein EBQ58_07275 [Betaproteobacteria bacterium]|nr:hypothetical protein [Betaproteobacteria bacterium]
MPQEQQAAWRKRQGGVELAGADAGAAGAGAAVCACEGLQASRLMQATDMKDSLKQGDFNA